MHTPWARCLLAFLIFAPIRQTVGRAESPEVASANGVYNVVEFGAKGDGASDDTTAIQKAIDTAAEHGGGQVLLPGGKTFCTGAITLKSKIDFHLARGTTLKGQARWQDYHEAGALLFAKDAVGLSVTGDGVIDGNDKAVWQHLADEEAGGDVNKAGWWPQSFCGIWWPFGRPASEKTLSAGRPMVMILLGCKQVRLRDFTIRNASTWTVHTIGCEDLVIDSISILNDWDIANNDGIDLDHCRNVRVANCHIDTADDAIVLKNTPNFESYGRSENIIVTGCTLKSRSGALKIDEIYTTPGVRNVIFDACTISHSNRGLMIQSRDIGEIENVLFSNITVETELQPLKWWGAGEPIHISQLPRSPGTKLGTIRHLRFVNILCKSESGVFLRAEASSPIEDIVLDNVRVEIEKSTEQAGGFYDERPIGRLATGEWLGIYNDTIAGIRAEGIDGLTLRNTQVVWGQRLAPYYGPALLTKQVRNLSLQNFTGDAARTATTQASNDSSAATKPNPALQP